MSFKITELITSIIWFDWKIGETPNNPKKENINAFNLGFEDENYDESKDATIVSNHLGIKLEKETLTPNDLIKQLPHFFKKFDMFKFEPKVIAQRLPVGSQFFQDTVPLISRHLALTGMDKGPPEVHIR